MRRRAKIAMTAALLAAACATTSEPAGKPVPTASPTATSAAATPAQGPQAVPAEGLYTQAASGMAFPESVGAFERTAVTRYRPDGTDESAGYNFEGPDGAFIIATVYVYPSLDIAEAQGATEPRGQLCSAQFRAAHVELVAATPNAEVVDEGEVTLSQGGARYVGPSAIYLYSPDWARTADGQAVPLGSHLHLFCYVGGQWSVKYRISYPEDFDAGPLISDFMSNLVLTIGPQRRDGALSAEREPAPAPGRAGETGEVEDFMTELMLTIGPQERNETP